MEHPSHSFYTEKERPQRTRYFVANKNNRDTVRQYLNPRIRARYLRFVPVTWNKWICMRVEIYGCDAGESLQDKLEKKLLDISKERVEYVFTYPGLIKNPYRKDINIYYKRTVVRCGVLPRYGVQWGNHHYLKEILDLTQTAWVQKTFKNEFNASSSYVLFLDERRILKTRSSKHFMCKGKMRDGTELYRHHVITAKVGFKAPTKYDSRPFLLIGTKAHWNSGLEVPQIIVQQRVDPAYDGGKPIWETPAVVYASGSVASIGVFVVGIPYFTVGIPRAYIDDRGWSLSYLGPVRNDIYAQTNCATLAQLKGFDHYVWKENMCYSSHAIPANIYKMPDNYPKNSDKEHREWNRPHFIKGMRKFEKYEVTWSKFDRTRNRWVQLFKYVVLDPDRQNSLLFTMKFVNDNDYYTYVRTRARGRYRAYDKAYYGDYFTGSHVLDIERLTAADLGTYKVEVYIPGRKVGNEAIIELRHEGEREK
ncbi:hypothetical protein OS493_027176 [Desmophyllum pertusum]|uniref:F5/8 type C domain-containing protein n=1 Tax=Desmophyllum pertusum TaxID=174260 RepID=A0A9W9ZYE5_9CNID|nr:hypothetical protein OS493_027176 [Desmophyllum pertusum]